MIGLKKKRVRKFFDKYKAHDQAFVDCGTTGINGVSAIWVTFVIYPEKRTFQLQQTMQRPNGEGYTLEQAVEHLCSVAREIRKHIEPEPKSPAISKAVH